MEIQNDPLLAQEMLPEKKVQLKTTNLTIKKLNQVK
jgi:hypothetical protein